MRKARATKAAWPSTLLCSFFGRLDYRKLDRSAIKIPDEDPRSLATKRGRMGKSIGYGQGGHLSRLDAQQTILEPDLPEGIL
jgi:hypothetical protein